MGLRIATEEDFDLVLKHAQAFKDAIDMGKYYDMDKLTSIVREFVSSDNTSKIIILYDDVGMLAGTKEQFPFGTDYMAIEVAWWVDPEHRKSNIGKELLEAFEYWGKLVGCKLITMASLDETVGKFYQKCGYRPYDHTFVKEL